MNLEHEILSLLEEDPKLTQEDIALRLGTDTKKVKQILAELEDKKIILGYRTVINWDYTDKDTVTAMIEVRITPQRGLGFDKIAKRIYSFPEVKDCYLVSGGFDLMIIIEGETLKEVAAFVSDKVAPLDSVLSTQTHFILKKYKSYGIVYEKADGNDREAIVL